MFVEDLAAPVLSDADRHHLERVLRLRPGDALTVGDGAGRWRTGVFATELDCSGPIVEQSVAAPTLTIGFALVKGDKPELIVQKLTELGIDRIVLFCADRSVVRWDAPRAEKALTRLRTVARAAAMQCHRAWLPTVEELADLTSLSGRPGVALAQRGGAAPTSAHRTVLIGPEGGWSERERALRAPSVGFGQDVLRAETAAITAGAILSALRAGIVGSAASAAT